MKASWNHEKVCKKLQYQKLVKKLPAKFKKHFNKLDALMAKICSVGPKKIVCMYINILLLHLFKTNNTEKLSWMF